MKETYNRVKEGGGTFQVTTRKLWNSLPLYLKMADLSDMSFRKELFSYFFNFYKKIKFYHEMIYDLINQT